MLYFPRNCGVLFCLIEVDEATAEIKMTGATFEMSVKPKRVRSARPATAPRTGTDV